MKLFKSISMMTAVLGLPVLLAAVPAQAFDSKVLPGNVCQTASQSGSVTRSGVRLIDPNTGVSKIYYCSFPSDAVSINTASLKYVGNSTNGTISCTLVSTNSRGGTIGQQQKFPPEGSTPNARTFSDTSVAGSPAGTYYFKCTPPAPAGGGRHR